MNNELYHYGVKGMKWGVRHDRPSLGQRYSTYGRKVSNKRYDKASAKIEERRKKRSEENYLRNTRYGKRLDRKSNERYDREQQKIEKRRANRNQEFDEFDKARNKIYSKAKSFDKKKALKIGAVAIGGILAAGSVAYLAKSGALSSVAKNGANVARRIFLKNKKTSAKVLTPHDYAWAHSKSSGIEVLSNKPASHNTFEPKVIKGTLDKGKKTVFKIANSSGSKSTSYNWEKLAKNNKDLLDKTLNFNMVNYTLDELRKLDLW